jgi:hypothetical protein
LIGPAAAGLLIQWFGTGPVFWINAATFAAVIFSLLRMDASGLCSVRSSSGRSGGVREGLSYVRGRPDILLILVMVGLVGTFSLKFQITTALMARLVFDRGAGEFGILGSTLALGSLAGALLVARRDRPDVRLVLGASAGFGAAEAVAALMPSYALFALSLIPVGIGALMVMTAANSTVQLTTPEHMRGRVMALYMAVFMGGAPLGAPLVGWIGQELGARWSLAVGAFVALGAAAGAAVWTYRRPPSTSASDGSPAEGGDDEQPQWQRRHEGQGRYDDRRGGPALQGLVPLCEEKRVTAHR